MDSEGTVYYKIIIIITVYQNALRSTLTLCGPHNSASLWLCLEQHSSRQGDKGEWGLREKGGTLGCWGGAKEHKGHDGGRGWSWGCMSGVLPRVAESAPLSATASNVLFPDVTPVPSKSHVIFYYFFGPTRARNIFPLADAYGTGRGAPLLHASADLTDENNNKTKENTGLAPRRWRRGEVTSWRSLCTYVPPRNLSLSLGGVGDWGMWESGKGWRV